MEKEEKQVTKKEEVKEQPAKKEEGKQETTKKEEIKKEEKKPVEKKTETAKTQSKKTEPKKEEKKTKSKSIWGIVVGIILIVALVIGIVCTIALQDNPTSSINGMLNALKAGDFAKVEEFVNYQEVIQDSEFLASQDIDAETQKLFFDRLEWKINEVKKDANAATAQVEITNKDYKVIISNYMQKALKAAFGGESMTDQEMENYLIEELKNQETQTATSTVTMQLEKVDGEWRITANEDLINGLMPGLQEAIDTLNTTNVSE